MNSRVNWGRRLFISTGLAACILESLMLAGCGKKAGSAGSAQGMPAIQVVAVEAKSQPVNESLSLVGTITPNESVEIKAETEGIVQEINFKEGERVEKGRLLVKLDESKLSA